MAKTPPGTIKETGANPGQILIGIDAQLNRGLRIKVHKRQDSVGKRIDGNFDLLSAGRGTYAKYLEELVGESFDSANTLIDKICAKGGDKCTHILNRNTLKVEE